jgi:NADH pyrophosphatase NudC (nudix superfamily)
VFLSTINHVLFVVQCGKGMFSTLLGVCTSCVACPRVEFDQVCPSINVHSFLHVDLEM